MISIDTNILIYARIKESLYYEAASSVLEKLGTNRKVIIAELVLVEFYLALRNPKILSVPLTAKQAVQECNLFRQHPYWQLVEQATIMDSVWKEAAYPDFARRKIIDLRLAKTLQACGVTEFITANIKDFQNMGFEKVWNPLN